MSMISTLLEKIKSKRVEKFASVSEKYDSAILALAKGEQVDADALAEMLDELDKSDNALEVDIAAKQRRIEAAAELQRLATVAAKIPSKELELSKLNDEITSYVAARKPKIQALSEELKMLRLEVDRRGYFEHDLLNVGIPLSIAQRKDALAKRQATLSAMRARYLDQTEVAIRNLEAFEVRLKSVDDQIAKSTESHFTESLQKDRDGFQRRVDSLTQQIAAWAPLKAEIEQEQSSITAESNEIRKLLMNP